MSSRNPWCVYVPATGLHGHCKGRNSLAAFSKALESIRAEGLAFERNVVICRAMDKPVTLYFRWWRNGLLQEAA